MSTEQDHGFDVKLLDLHLGHLPAAEAEALRARIAADPDLAQQDQALAGVFRALQMPGEAQMPGDLVERTLARVAAAGEPPRVVRPSDELTREVEDTANGGIIFRIGGSLREIVAVAAIIVLAIGVGVPSMLHLRERSQRMGCSWNLAQLGQGVQQYASVFDASLPFAGWGDNAYSWQATSNPDVVNVPNRRHVYPLLRLAYVSDPRMFVCPSQRHVPMPESEVERHDDFLEDRNVSYAYQNMAGVRPTANDDPQLVILADDNPLFSNGLPMFDPRRFTGFDPQTANSEAHRGAGQNVLTLAGNVKWVTTPMAGVDGNNIWLLDGDVDYTGHEGPKTSTDSHLIK